MKYDKILQEIATAMYDHRFVTVNLTNGQSVNGRISNLVGTTFKIGFSPKKSNRFSFDRVASVKMY